MSNIINLSNAGTILSNIGNKLIENKNLMRCIAYDTPDALSPSLPDVPIEEIIKLVGKGDDPKNQQKIYKYPFNNSIIDSVRSELRFFIPRFKPDNLYITGTNIGFETIVYNTLVDLEDNKFRYLVMVQEILNSLNGFDCGGIGLLYLTQNSSINIMPYNNNFSGYTFFLSTRLR